MPKRNLGIQGTKQKYNEKKKKKKKKDTVAMISLIWKHKSIMLSREVEIKVKIRDCREHSIKILSIKRTHTLVKNILEKSCQRSSTRAKVRAFQKTSPLLFLSQLSIYRICSCFVWKYCMVETSTSQIQFRRQIINLRKGIGQIYEFISLINLKHSSSQLLVKMNTRKQTQSNDFI